MRKRDGFIYLIALGLFLFCMSFSDTSIANAEVINVSPSHDVSVYENNPNKNFDNDDGAEEDKMRVRGSGLSSVAAISYYTFDLTNQNQDSPFEEATFKVFGRVTDNLPQGQTVTFNVYAVSDSTWDESTMTWNSRPALGEWLASAQIGTVNGSTTFTITDYVNDQMTGDKVVSLALITDESHQYFTRGKNFRNINHRPSLELIPHVPLPTHKENVSPSHDVSVYENNPNKNFNNDDGAEEDKMRVRGSGLSSNAAISYYTFDLTNQDSPFEEATFKVFGRVTDNLPQGQTVTFDLYAVLDSTWDESTMTWNSRPALGEWLASAQIGTVNGSTTFTITDYVNDQIIGDKVVSLALITDEPHQYFTRGKNFRNINHRPSLELISYAPLPTHKDLELDGRSSLYPQDWYPGYEDSEGRFLHDFSYAGYKMGEIPIPSQIPGVQINASEAPYSADPTGNQDATAAIQAAIDEVGRAGGGVVYLPAGTYRVKPPTGNNYALQITESRVVLRGAGANETFIFNDDTQMRSKSILQVGSDNGLKVEELSGTLLTQDVLRPTNRIFIDDVTQYNVGDWIALTALLTEDFIAEHNMDGWWDNRLNRRQIFFYRKIVALDENTSSIVIDVPTRYPLKIRDNASVYKLTPPQSENGIEDLSIGNRESLKSGWKEGDFSIPGTGGYDSDNARMIFMHNVVDSWVQRVNSYQPTVNTLPEQYHLLSRGIVLSNTKNVSILNNDIRNPQYRGANGNGYLFSISGNDNLIADNMAVNGRHNYTFSGMSTNGNVILKSHSITPVGALDFHMHLSMANLLDSMVLNNDMISASVRPYPSYSIHKHGMTTSESVIWNTYGEGYLGSHQVIIDSRQYGNGYVIGTQGPSHEVLSTPLTISERNTAPEDFVEGVGQGVLLQPQSLYLDQLQRRLAGQSTQLGNITINGMPLVGFQIGRLQYEVELPYGTNPQDLPVVAASATDAAASISIDQATSLPGQAEIVVTSEDHSIVQQYVLKFSISTSVPTLTTIVLSPNRSLGGWKLGSARLEEGYDGVLRLSGRMSDGSTVDYSGNQTLFYTSSNSAIATIDGNGVVSAHSHGETLINAQLDVNGVIYHSSIQVIVSPVYIAPERDFLEIAEILDSENDGNIPTNTLDSDMGTRWSASGIGQWIRYDLGSIQLIDAISISFYRGDSRSSIFDLEVSVNGVDWDIVHSGQSSGVSNGFETYLFNPIPTRYVRYNGKGNTDNLWNSVTELRVHPYNLP